MATSNDDGDAGILTTNDDAANNIAGDAGTPATNDDAANNVAGDTGTNDDTTTDNDGDTGTPATNDDAANNVAGDAGILQVSESKEGYMYKEGNNKRSWEKRYFILKEDRIDYFKTKGDERAEGTIILTEGKGVREKDQCTCNWPSDTNEDYCFGLAIKSQTWYFYTTSEEGSVGDWKRLIQEIIDKVGTPDPDCKNDHEGKPLSFFAKKAASIGAIFTKIAMKFAPVDDRVKDGVTAGADMVKDQAEADSDASFAERAALAAKGGAGVVGGAVGGDVAKNTCEAVSTGAEVVAEVCKEIRKEEKKSKENKSEENDD